MLNWINGELVSNRPKYLERVRYADLMEEKKMSLTDKLIAYEDGELTSDEEVDLFAQLIRNGMAWTLQGSYGRRAIQFIEGGFISEDGTVKLYPD